MMSLRLVLAWLIVAFALVAAICWFKAGSVSVSPEQAQAQREAHFEKHGRTAYAAWTLFDGSDMEFTLKAQAKWNRRGAIAAGLAATCQAAYVWITEIA